MSRNPRVKPSLSDLAADLAALVARVRAAQPREPADPDLAPGPPWERCPVRGCGARYPLDNRDTHRRVAHTEEP